MYIYICCYFVCPSCARTSGPCMVALRNHDCAQPRFLYAPQVLCNQGCAQLQGRAHNQGCAQAWLLAATLVADMVLRSQGYKQR